MILTLEYHLWRPQPPSGEDLVGNGRPLHNVHEVSVSRFDDGSSTVWAHGRMLKRDGTPGPNRCFEVDVDAKQPDWLAQIIEDARWRLRSRDEGGDRR